MSFERVSVSKEVIRQNQLVQTKVSLAFEQQLANLEQYGGPDGRINPSSATKVFLAAVNSQKEAQADFSNDRTLLQALKDSPSKTTLEAISRNDLVYSAYSFLDNLNQVQPNKKHVKDKALAEFIKGPVFKKALNILFAEELKSLTDRDAQALQKQEAGFQRVSRTVQESLSSPEAVKAPAQFTVLSGNKKLIDFIPLFLQEVIVDKIFDQHDETGRITRDEFKTIILDLVKFEKAPSDDSLRSFSTDLGFGKKDYKNARKQ